MSSQHNISSSFENFLTKLGLGMRAKLIVIFVIIKVLPLIFIALVAWQQALSLGEEMKIRTQSMADKAVNELTQAGKLAVDDAVRALDDRGTQEIERLTTDTARHVANFLYERDDDIRTLAAFPVDENIYKTFVEHRQIPTLIQSKWVLAEDGKSWVSTKKPDTTPDLTFASEQNSTRFKYTKPTGFEFEAKPLYLEMTFVDLSGQEKIKIVTSDIMDPTLKDISDKKNTFIKAENYFEHLKDLEPGEIYVSDVIGAYVGTPFIGPFTPENAKKKNVPYEPEKAAFSGPENPNGKRFQGVVRWATPVEKEGKVIGYITLALNHDHIMSLVNHLTPKAERYTELSDPIEGDYVFIWDHKGRNIVHPRHHSIVGYDPETGDPYPAWLEDKIYERWQDSGQSYAEFIETVPTFEDQRRDKKFAKEQLSRGDVGLDCRYLNFAPQCTDWYAATKNGGSGSFLILWSGLWKLTTTAAIPYYTGQYGDTKRGFGIITATSGIENFHAPAIDTQEEIQKIITNTDAELDEAAQNTFDTIAKHLWETTLSLSVSTVVMTLLVILVAIWMASSITQKITYLIAGITRFRHGERHFRFNETVKDELGELADSLDDLSQSIEDSVKGPATITDLDGRVIYMNAMTLELLDATMDGVLGKKYTDVSIYDEESNPIVCFLEGREQTIVQYVPTHTYYKSNVNYLIDKDGENVAYIIVLEDVTMLITEQERIERERALLDTVISSSPDLIWYLSANETFLFVNSRFASSFGMTPEEVHGRKASQILPPVVYEAIRSNDREAIDYRSPMHSEERLLFADGHEEILDVVRTPLFAIDNKLRGVLGVARDVTQRVTVEKELRQMQRDLINAVAEANKASDSKSEFLARMSHEIRTPMNAILGMTNITKRKLSGSVCTNDDLMPHIAQIESSSQHLLGLLNDILDISKIEAGKIELCEDSFSLTKLVEEVSVIIKPRCSSKNIDFSVNVTSLPCENYISDGLRLRQILINLLGNAVKFTQELGKISFNVKILERQDGKSLLFFSVTDTGIGISEEAISKLFNPFEQANSHITRHYGGTGLGLSISQKIAMLFGSSIKVKSTLGEGSEFAFEVWLKEDISTSISESTHQGHVVVKPGQRILLVDDVDINRIIAMELLSPFECEIDEATDGQEAVDIFAKSPVGYYKLIFMDLQMPNMNGHDSAKTIRQLDREDAATVPIVAMTANAFREDIDQCMASGMNEHVAKPIDLERLNEVIKTYLGNTK